MYQSLNMVANSLLKYMDDLSIIWWSSWGIVVVQSEYLPYIGRQCQLRKSWFILFISNNGNEFFAGYSRFIYPQNSHLHLLWVACLLSIQSLMPMNLLRTLNVAAECTESPSFTHLLDLVPPAEKPVWGSSRPCRVTNTVDADYWQPPLGE